MNLKRKNEKGITLVALVVTIVVLIILATISINAVFGEDGIIKRAEEARDRYANAEYKEQDELNRLYDELGEVLGENSSGDTGTTLVDMYNAAIAANCEGGENCTDPENHLHVGDYLNYENPTSGSVTVAGTVTGVADGVENNYSAFSGLVAEDINQTYTLSSEKNNVKWRVMGIDKNTGGIKLVADSVMEKDVTTSTQTGLYVYGAKSYLNSVTVTEETGEKKVGFLDNICSMYANTKYGRGTVARSLTAEDINEMLGITTADDIKTYDLAKMMGATKEYGETYTYENQFKPEDWEKANEDGEVTDDEKPAEITGIQDGYMYTVNAAMGEGAPFVTASDAAYDLIVCTELPYWLASRGALAVSGGAGFGPGAAGPDSGGAVVFCCHHVGCGFSSDGGEIGAALPVRPVVCLESGVTANDLQVYTPDAGE